MRPSSAARSVKTSIKTIYNGREFRSKLEADYARAFDTLEIEWEYEKAGQYFGRHVFYLPDFYLPRSRQYFEVKGVFEPDDVRKIVALLEHVPARPHTTDPRLEEGCPDVPLIAGMPGGDFFGWLRGKVRPHDNVLIMSKRASCRVELYRCAECRGWWFCVPELSWRCQCCGVYDGDAHLLERIESPFPGFPHLDVLETLGHDF